jgi:hypothetical protein
MSKTQNTPTPTIITLTLPEPESEGTLLIQRGDLAHMSQFPYTAETDFTALVQQALAALAVVEGNPPVIPDEPACKTTTRAVAPPEPPEPMLDIPVKTRNGTTAIPARFVQITGGEVDEAAQQQALKVAGRLLDSELWDGKTPIGIDDAPAVLRRLDGLTDKELKVLFRLEQFAQLNPVVTADDIDTPQDDLAEDQAVQDVPEILEAADTSEQPALI